MDRYTGRYNIIAPYWTDLHPTTYGNGAMYYHVYSEGDSNGNNTQTEFMINKVSTTVNYYGQTKDFKASCVYVATWDHVDLYDTNVSTLLHYT